MPPNSKALRILLAVELRPPRNPSSASSLLIVGTETSVGGAFADRPIGKPVVVLCPLGTPSPATSRPPARPAKRLSAAL
jgi:hypothetical protein